MASAEDDDVGGLLARGEEDAEEEDYAGSDSRAHAGGGHHVAGGSGGSGNSSDEQGDSGDDSPDDYEDSDDDDEDDNDDEDDGIRRKMSELRGMMGSLYPFQAPTSYNNVDILLAKDDVELEQVLDLDDFLADLRRTKVKLMDFLQRPPILRGLVEFISAEKYPAHIEPDKAKRYAHLAYEAIQSEALKEAVINSTELLDQFFGFLDITAEMDPLRCAYFSRIVEILFERFPKELINYLKKKKDIVGKFVWHINNQYIVESLFRLIDSQASHPWLHDEDLIPLLMIKMAEAEDPEIQDKTSQAFVEILDLFVPFPYSVLTTQMFHSVIVAEQWELFTMQDVKDHRRILNGINVAIGILSLSFDGNMSEQTPIFMQKAVSLLDFFLGLLRVAPNPEESFPMTYGVLQPPFGFLRLKILEFFSALMNSKYPEVLLAMLRADLFETLQQLFFNYPWNNTMHFYIQHILNVMLQCECDTDGQRVTTLLLDQGGFAARVADAFEQQTDRTVGYLGHLVGLCGDLLRLTADRPALKQFLGESEPWKRLCAGKLKDAMDRHSKPLVERPPGLTDDVFNLPMDGAEYEAHMEEGSDDDVDFSDLQE